MCCVGRVCVGRPLRDQGDGEETSAEQGLETRALESDPEGGLRGGGSD